MAAQMHAHHLIPVVLAHADEHAVAHDAGVVHQRMYFAISGDGGVDDFLRGFHARDVVAGGDGLATCGDDFVAYSFGRFGADVIDHHICAFGSKCQCISLAQATAGAGNDYGTLSANSHFLSSSFSSSR